MKKYIFLTLIILGALNLSSCGDNSRATKEAEEKARIEAEEQARIEAEEQARIEAEEKARIEAEEKARIEAEEQARLEKLREFDGKHKWEGNYHGMYLIGFKFDVEDGKVVKDFALWETGGASSWMEGKIENGVFYGNVPYGSNECWVRLNLNTGEAQINWNSYGEDNVTFKRKY